MTRFDAAKLRNLVKKQRRSHLIKQMSDGLEPLTPEEIKELRDGLTPKHFKLKTVKILGPNNPLDDKSPEPAGKLPVAPREPVKSISDAFAEVVVGQFLSDQQTANALCKAFARVGITLPRPDFLHAAQPPETAPKLWADRPRGRETNPAAFIREVYADWLPHALARSDLKQLDPQLYTAYAQWTRPDRHPDDTVTFAPKRPPPNKLDDVEFASRQRAAKAAWLTQQRASQRLKGPGET